MNNSDYKPAATLEVQEVTKSHAAKTGLGNRKGIIATRTLG